MPLAPTPPHSFTILLCFLLRAPFHRVSPFQVHRLLGEAWAGLRGNPTTNRKAGPFLNLPGSVGHVAFTYNDVLPAPPDWSMVRRSY